MSAPLGERPQRFTLLQAVRAFETAGQRVRFGGATETAFPQSDIQALRRHPDGAWLIETAALSLFGPHGPMPPPLGEAVAQAARDGEPAARDFFDLFHDRLIRLLVETQRLERPAASAEPPERSMQGDVLRALVGRLDEDAPDGLTRSLMALAGLARQRPQSLHAAERALACRLGVAVRARGMIGGWTPLPAGAQARLSATEAGPGLGAAALGSACWTPDAGVRFDVGPLDGARFHALLPTGAGHGPMVALADAVLPPELDMGCRLVVSGAGAPQARLGRARLGWTSILRPHAMAASWMVDLRLNRPGGGVSAGAAAP